MELPDVQIQRLARNIVDSLERDNASQFISKKEVVISKTSDIIKDNFNAEKKLDIEARRLADQLIAGSGDSSLDRHKLFKMTKKRLAKRKGFIL